MDQRVIDKSAGIQSRLLNCPGAEVRFGAGSGRSAIGVGARKKGRSFAEGLDRPLSPQLRTFNRPANVPLCDKIAINSARYGSPPGLIPSARKHQVLLSDMADKHRHRMIDVDRQPAGPQPVTEQRVLADEVAIRQRPHFEERIEWGP